MKIWRTTDPQPQSDTEQLWVYNGLDCAVTMEVLHAISPQLDELTSRTYAFSLALQAPVLEMECRGVLINLDERARVQNILEIQLAQVEASLKEILKEGLDIEINWNSPAQLQELFYEILGLPRVRFQGKPTVNRNALEKLKGYFYAEPIVRHILAARDLKKRLSTLKTGIDSDGRIRTSFNIAGTSTGRFSSYESSFGSGTNLQNITEELRQIFVADRGYKFAQIDKKQIQSRIVGAICWNYFHDPLYLDVCESEDLHTMVAKACWVELPWKGERKYDRAIADQIFYRLDSYRQASKKLGHATNFYGRPPQISKEVGIPIQLVADFQGRYFKSFPRLRDRFDATRKLLLSQGYITTMTGRRRHFFGRRWEDEVLREALAYEPQEVEAYIVNTGLLNIWRHAKYSVPMLQGHDAILIQFKEEDEADAVYEAERLMDVDVPLMHGRVLRIPSETHVGWNWAKQKDPQKNPDGLIPFGSDKRKRTYWPPTSFMDRKFY